jgi:tetratricopeptide (TPR) repeat protein
MWNQSNYFRGRCYFAKGNYDEAIRDLSAAIQTDPNNQVAYKFRGMAYSARKDFNNAIRDLNEAIRIAPIGTSITIVELFI